MLKTLVSVWLYPIFPDMRMLQIINSHSSIMKRWANPRECTYFVTSQSSMRNAISRSHCGQHEAEALCWFAKVDCDYTKCVCTQQLLLSSQGTLTGEADSSFSRFANRLATHLREVDEIHLMNNKVPLLARPHSKPVNWYAHKVGEALGVAQIPSFMFC